MSLTHWFMQTLGKMLRAYYRPEPVDGSYTSLQMKYESQNSRTPATTAPFLVGRKATTKKPIPYWHIMYINEKTKKRAGLTWVRANIQSTVVARRDETAEITKYTMNHER